MVTMIGKNQLELIDSQQSSLDYSLEVKPLRPGLGCFFCFLNGQSLNHCMADICLY